MMQSYMSKYMTKESTEYNEFAAAAGAALRAAAPQIAKGVGIGAGSALVNNVMNKPANMKKSLKEDALIAPPVTEPKPGEVGFAPQGSLNGIGGGYSMSDFADIPILGESTKYPSFTNWLSKKKS
jgi:hypothetical protein